MQQIIKWSSTTWFIVDHSHAIWMGYRKPNAILFLFIVGQKPILLFGMLYTLLGCKALQLTGVKSVLNITFFNYLILL